MGAEKVIEIHGVSKRFSKNIKSTRKQLKHIVHECFFGKRNNQALNEGEFWALKDVSFDIEENESVAILGGNGAGKSTLLKMLNGIYLPDEGEVSIKGSVGSVLELSTGFDSQLSGLENIYLKCAMMGVFEEKVEPLVEDIIAFSELSDFIGTPLSHYSSGMKARLGFAIVVHIKPDILMLDEVFAVGDKSFQKKSAQAISTLSNQATTIIVSHNMDVVKSLANRVVVLQGGEKCFDGLVDEGVAFYNALV